MFGNFKIHVILIHVILIHVILIHVILIHVILILYFSILLIAVDCGFLQTPDNSRVTITGTVVNSIATYSCFPGYELVGDETRTCVANGQWAGQAPFCKGMNGCSL